MFASYAILSDKLINHHQISKGFVLMYSHIAIVVSILLSTVSLLYLQIKNVNKSFLFFLLIGSLGLYYFSLTINQIYNKNTCKFAIRDFLVGSSLLMVGNKF